MKKPGMLVADKENDSACQRAELRNADIHEYRASLTLLITGVRKLNALEASLLRTTPNCILSLFI